MDFILLGALCVVGAVAGWVLLFRSAKSGKPISGNDAWQPHAPSTFDFIPSPSDSQWTGRALIRSSQFVMLTANPARLLANEQGVKLAGRGLLSRTQVAFGRDENFVVFPVTGSFKTKGVGFLRKRETASILWTRSGSEILNHLEELGFNVDYNARPFRWDRQIS